MTDPADKDKIRARMLKMLALAEDAGATGGESDTARRMLESLMAKHGITMDELTGQQEPKPVHLKYSDTEDRELMFAVLYKVLNVSSIRYRQPYKSRAIIVNLTPEQHADVEVLRLGYGNALKRHMKAARMAFMMRNRIYAESPPDCDSDSDSDSGSGKGSDKDRGYDLSEAVDMALAIKPTVIHKQIEA